MPEIRESSKSAADIDDNGFDLSTGFRSSSTVPSQPQKEKPRGSLKTSMTLEIARELCS